jgi:hypothetical protein
MAHFAKLDADNNVIHVSVVDDVNCLDADGNESEQVGILYLTQVHGYDKWKQCSYNRNMRKHYPGLGFRYDERLDAFIPPKQLPSYVFNEELCAWEPPVPYPTDGQDYRWDEETVSWILDPGLQNL